MFAKSQNSKRGFRIASLVLCLLLLTVSLPVLAQETENLTAAATSVQEPTTEATSGTDEFEVTTRGDYAFIIVIIGVIGSFAFAIITGVRQQNLAVELAKTLRATMSDAKTGEALSRQFTNLPPHYQSIATQVLAVLDPLSRFTTDDLDDDVVAWLYSITDGTLTHPTPTQTARRGTDASVPPTTFG